MPDLSQLTQIKPYHVLTYGLLTGTQIFHSFIGGPLAFKTLSRPMFAQLQSVIFPIYFGMQTCLPAVLAMTYQGKGGLTHEQNRWSVLVPLLTTFVSGLANLTFIGPATTKVMRQRKSQEHRDGKKSFDPPPHSEEMKSLNKKFGILHGISSLINLVAIVATCWYGFTLSESMN